MKVLKSWLQEHIVETLPSDEEITKAFIFKSSEVEGVEKVKVNGKDDTVFDLKVLPDRAHYMLSHRGVAYDLCAILGLTLKKSEDLQIEKDNSNSLNIESDLCRRYTATYISNIKNTESPIWIKERLESIGAKSINLIVDIANIAMFDTGQPLHVFDADLIDGNITVRKAKNGESIETLSGQSIELKSEHLVIADGRGPLAIAGIKGGKRAEVTLGTKNIVLEAANFDPVSIRKTSIEVGIRNDASKRFENEITPYLVQNGISSFLKLIRNEIPVAEIGKLNDVYKSLPKSWMVVVRHSEIEQVLNLKIEKNEVISILQRLGCEAVNKGEKYEVTPPHERLDLVISADIIDEIGRIYGLDKVKSIVPKLKTNHEFSKEFLIIEKIKDFLYVNGFSEVITRSFTNNGDIEVSYPMASDKGFLRRDLKTNVLHSLDLALKNAPLLKLDEIKIFEIGKVFTKSGEKNSLTIAIKNINKKEKKEKDKLEEICSSLKEKFGIEYKIDNSPVVEIDLESVLKDYRENIDLNSININKGTRNQFKPFSPYPFVVRDVAVFVPNNIQGDLVWNVIIDIGKDTGLLVNHELFDVFKKDDKTSYAYRLVFQSQERTLTSEEIDLIMNKIYKALRDKGWEVR